MAAEHSRAFAATARVDTRCTGDERVPWTPLDAVEDGARRLTLAVCVLAAVLAVVTFERLSGDRTALQGASPAAGALRLVDGAGRARLHAAMYSGVPVLQLSDDTGRARLTLGLRLDQTPFIAFDDAEGHPRLALQAGDQPALRVLDASGTTTFAAR